VVLLPLVDGGLVVDAESARGEGQRRHGLILVLCALARLHGPGLLEAPKDDLDEVELDAAVLVVGCDALLGHGLNPELDG